MCPSPTSGRREKGPLQPRKVDGGPDGGLDGAQLLDVKEQIVIRGLADLPEGQQRESLHTSQKTAGSRGREQREAKRRKANKKMGKANFQRLHKDSPAHPLISCPFITQ